MMENAIEALKETASLLVSADELGLLLNCRACCQHHKDILITLSEDLARRCRSTHNSVVLPLIRLSK